VSEYIVVAVVKNDDADPPVSYMAPNNTRRYPTPRDAVEHVREIVADGFFAVEAIDDAPPGIPSMFIIPVARVIQWHIVEAPNA
jgi:hypothetical protein